MLCVCVCYCVLFDNSVLYMVVVLCFNCVKQQNMRTCFVFYLLWELVVPTVLLRTVWLLLCCVVL